MSQQEQNTASTKAFILECVDSYTSKTERERLDAIRYLDHWKPYIRKVDVDYHKMQVSIFEARIKELKIRRQEVCEMLEGVEDE